jgi:nicotinamidase-related amidase
MESCKMESPKFFRSPELMQPEDTALVVVDVQEKLLPVIPSHVQIVWNIRRLLDAAKLLQVPALATEQYPQGLGPTVSTLASYFGDIPSKLSFSCAGSEQLTEQLEQLGRLKLLLVGMESHVCVQQTALDLLSAGYRIYVAVDAIGARKSMDHEVALRRMETLGATLTTTESVIFEWCAQAGTDEFRAVRKLVMETPPQEV